MAINSALRKFGKVSRSQPSRRPEPLAIGEVDPHVFNCPNCARPLANGATFCPGCGTRLIVGVRAKLALGFMAVGLVAGTLLGGGAMIVVGGRQASPGTAATITTPAASGGTVPAASIAPVLPADVGIPSKAVSALRQATVVNGRLTAYAAELDRILGARSTEGIDVARILRAMSADVLFGVYIAPSIAPWPEAAALSADLGSFYARVRDASQASLKASVSNTTAYRAAGKRMVALLAKLPALDTRADEIVAAAGLAPLKP